MLVAMEKKLVVAAVDLNSRVSIFIVIRLTRRTSKETAVLKWFMALWLWQECDGMGCKPSRQKIFLS